MALSCPRKLKTWQQKRHLAGLQDTQIRQEQRRWEEDCELIEFKGQCDEYLEMGEQWPSRVPGGLAQQGR